MGSCTGCYFICILFSGCVPSFPHWDTSTARPTPGRSCTAGICSPLSVSSSARYHRESSLPAPTSLISTMSEAGLGKAGASIPPCQGCERLGAELQPEPWQCSHLLHAGAPLPPVREQTPKRSPRSSLWGSAAFEDGLKSQSAALPCLG